MAVGDWQADRASYEVVLEAAEVFRDLHLALRLSLADAPWHEAPLAGWEPLMGDSRWLRVEEDSWSPTDAAVELALEGSRLMSEERALRFEGENSSEEWPGGGYGAR